MFPFHCPVQETESGHGIMEEPELTLISTSDISITETDFANLTLEEKGENEAKTSFQVNLRESTPLLVPGASFRSPLGMQGAKGLGHALPLSHTIHRLAGVELAVGT